MAAPDRNSAKEIFLKALEVPVAERSALLDRTCAGNEALRGEVEALLAAEEGQPLLATASRVQSADMTTAEADRLVGTRIGPYKLLELIGEGGFGAVYVAEQEKPVRRRVALKVIKLGMDTRQVIARFEAERQALAMMDHPNIARVLDAGATEIGRPWFAMELVRGVPITEYCDSANLTAAERLALFIAVCHAVQHAHQKGVIHRDIKPSNVMVTLHDGTPVPKVIDFGIAKAVGAQLTDKTVYTLHRQMIGTPAYMAPEQAEMSELDVDTRADVYSLGVLLYELLTGSPPFSAEELHKAGWLEMQRIIREVEPLKPSTRVNTLGETLPTVAARRRVEPKRLSLLLRGDLDWISMMCLEKDRARRYATANDLAADVLRHLNGEPVVAAPPSMPYRIRKLLRKYRGQVVAGSLISASLLVSIVITTIAWREASHARDAEALQRQIAETNERKAVAERDRADTERDLALRAKEEADSQRTRADREAMTAKALSDFLNEDLLEKTRSIEIQYSPPNQHQESTVQSKRRAPREKVDPWEFISDRLNVATRPGGRFADKPEIEASIRHSLGALLISIDDRDRAETHLRKATEIRSRVLGESHPDYLRSADLLAICLFNQGKHREAEGMLKRAIEATGMNSVLLPSDSCGCGGVLRTLSLLYLVQEKYKDWDEFVDPFVASELGADTVGLLEDLANQAHNFERYADAARLYEAILKSLHKSPEYDHAAATRIMNGLADQYGHLGKYQLADLTIMEAVDLRRRELGRDHPETLRAMMNLANGRIKHNHFGNGFQLFSRVQEAARRIKSHHPSLLPAVLYKLAQHHIEMLGYEPADSLLAEYLSLARQDTEKYES